MALPQWNLQLFGCLLREQVSIESLLRTQLSASLPAPFVSRRADESAPLRLSFGIVLTNKAMRAWEQWFTFDLHDGSLPFTMFLPWGDAQPQVRCRLLNAWYAQRIDHLRWSVRGDVEIERENLPSWSGGAR